TKLAALGPAEMPEYASAPATPAATASAEVETVPDVVAAETPAAAAAPARRKLSRRELAAIPKPTPTLLERVQERLRSDRRFGRVKAYTAGTVVTLYGNVFDDKDKAAAVRMARSGDGVTDVVDTLQTDSAEWAEMQNRIRAQLQGAGLEKVTVKVIGRDAYLDGEVKTELDRQRAVTIAQSAAPVTVRGNLIRVAIGNMFGF
ncbi:MAG: BON domain-containing protein, partial [Candidatus Binataceae bacterium]